jgi:uncharacterized membrane protein
MKLHATRTIPRPAGEVFTYLSDSTNNPVWQKGMRSCEWLEPAPIGVGSRYRQEAVFMGRRISSIFEVIAYTPGRSITIRTIESTFPIEVTRSVEPIDEASCIVTADISGGPRVPAPFVPFVQWMGQRSVSADYDRLVAELS